MFDAKFIERNCELQSPVDYVEDKEDDGEDDEEGDVNEGVVVLLPLAAAQLPKLHLHQDGRVPGFKSIQH